MLLAAVPFAALAALAIVAISARLLPEEAPAVVVSPPGTPRMVFAEFGVNEDRIYSAPADSPNDRTLHATIAHAPGWGLNPGYASAGSRFAYTVLPEDAKAEDGTPAELWMLDLDGENLTRLARDADLLVSPVFVEGGQALLYRRSDGTRQEIVRIGVADLKRDVLHREQTSFGIFPIGLRDGAVLFARLSAGGTDVLAVRDGDEPRLLFHASDDIARDWQLSPDGSSLAFLAPAVRAERVVYRAQVVSLDAGEPLALPGEGDGGEDAVPSAMEQYGPVWTPEGALTVGQEAARDAAAPALVLDLAGTRTELPPPEHGFDVPIAWSADGRYLAVRSFDGWNSVQPGLERTVIIDRLGARTLVEVRSEVIFMGWYADA